MAVFPMSLAIFPSYVKLPEGTIELDGGIFTWLKRAKTVRSHALGNLRTSHAGWKQSSSKWGFLLLCQNIF